VEDEDNKFTGRNGCTLNKVKLRPFKSARSRGGGWNKQGKHEFGRISIWKELRIA